MLELHAGNTSENIIVTLTELQTLNNPYYLFVFEHITTKAIVAFVAGQDQSAFQYRFNEFNLNTASLFSNKLPGQWNYTVYEQADPVNIDPTLALQPPLEYGKMILYKAAEFDYDVYDQPVTYKAYNG